MKKRGMREIISWAFFDFGNSAYSLLIMSLAFPLYFKEVIAPGSSSDFYWGLIVSISVLLGGLLAPIIGAMTDYDKKKKIRLIIFSTISIMATALLYFTGEGKIILAAGLFIISNCFFELAFVLYNSFLPDISTKKNAGRISGFGWGLGYLGGLIAMISLRPFYGSGFDGSLDATYRITFPLTAAFFLLFALPAFIFLRRDLKSRSANFFNSLRNSFRNLKKTFLEIRSYKSIALFLIGYYLISDVLVTIFAFIPIYARTTLSMNINEIFIILLIVQVVAIPGTIFFGWLGDKYSYKKILLLSIAFWIVSLILIASAHTKEFFYIAATMVGLVIGSSQSLARSWLTLLIPIKKQSEFFGFTGFASKVSATTGPLVFGTISTITGSQRLAILSLTPFFILAFIIFYKIKEK